MKKIGLFIIVCVNLLLTSCASHTRASLYPKMYEEKPVSLLVMPPINNTTNVEAKELLYTSISYPLIEAGYYVISPHFAMEFLKSESAYDAEMFIDGSISKFGDVFGVDAVIFSVIDVWQKEGTGIRTKIQYMIKSTKTNDILFDRTCELYLDLTKDSGKESTLGILSDLTFTVLATALTDHIEAARKSNRYIFSDIPRGKYSPEYGMDMDKPADDKDINVRVK